MNNIGSGGRGKVVMEEKKGYVVAERERGNGKGADMPCVHLSIHVRYPLENDSSIKK